MAKRNIKFNNNEYPIEESKFDPAVEKLINYFSTELAGTGVTLTIRGVKYNLDGTRVGEASNVLADFATNNSGTGHKMSIVGTRYEVSEDKLANAVETMDSYLANLSAIHVDPDSPDAPPTPDEPVLIPSEGLEYELNEDGVSYSLIGIGTCADVNVVIPETYEGLPVTELKPHMTQYEEKGYIFEISAGTFEDCDSIDSVILPEGITNICADAFKNSSVISVTVPSSVTTLDNSVFSGCIDLRSIYINHPRDGVVGAPWGAINATVYWGIEKEPVGPNHIPSQGLEYELNSDGMSYAVTGIGTCEDSMVIIPSSYNDLPVTELKPTVRYDEEKGTIYVIKGLFQGVSHVTGVVLPDSINHIAEYAFYDCGNLNNVILSDSIITIGKNAFKYCNNLLSLSLPDSVVSIESDAFYGSGIKRIRLSNGLTHIGKHVFSYCTNLKKVTIPNSVIGISAEAFYYCENLKTVNIPNTVVFVDQTAFSSCDGMDIYVDQYEDSIANAPWGATNTVVHWTHQEVEPDTPSTNTITPGLYETGTNYTVLIKTWDELLGEHAFSIYNGKLQKGVTPNDASATQNEYGFYYGIPYYCESSPETAYLQFGSDNIVHLWNKWGHDAYYRAEYSKKEVKLVECVEGTQSDGDYSNRSITFDGTGLLIEWFSFATNYTWMAGYYTDTSVYVGDIALPGDGSLVSPGNGLSGWTGLTGVLIPDNMRVIDDFAFMDCTNLSNVVIPDSVVYIGECAFDNTALNSFTVGPNVQYLGSGVVSCSRSYDTFEINFNAKALINEYTGYSFADVGRQVINIGPDVEAIPSNLFRNGAQMGTGEDIVAVNFAEGSVCKTIGEYAFAYNDTLTSITLPRSLTSISSNAFAGCDGRFTYGIDNQEYTLSDGLTDISFEGTRAEWIAIDKGSNWNGGVPATYVKCSDGMISVSVVKESEIYSSDGIDISYEGSFSSIVRGIGTCKGSDIILSTALHPYLYAIGAKAFSNCIGLSKVRISEGIRYIRNNAFENCINLEQVEIDSCVTTVEANAFNGCSSLSDIIFNGTIEQWESITRGEDWNYGVPAAYVQCTDGNVTI